MPFITLDPTDIAAVNAASNNDRPVPPIFYQQYDQRGDQDGPTLMLIHGAGGNYLNWPTQLRRLPNAAVYAIDLPGHGQSEAWSPRGDRAVTIEDYAFIVHSLIRQLALQNVIVVGHSMGAAIALTYALSYTSHLDQSVAEIDQSVAEKKEQSSPIAGMGLAGMILVGAGAALPVNPRIFVGLQDDFIGMSAKLVDWMYASDLSEEHRRRAIEDLRRNSPTQLLADFQACNAYDRRDALGKVTWPTLIICGELDQMTPISASQLLADGIPASELTIVPNSGHMVMLEEPEAIVARIQKFIDTNVTLHL